MTNTLLKAALRGSSCISAVALIGIFAAPAMAQTATPADTEAEAKEPATTIIVTGSRIRQPNLESANPITMVTGEQIFETGNLAIGDQLNDLPQLRSTWGQQNGTRSLGTRGISLLDLRGLGTARTLVLVNGRRHVAGDVLLNGVSPDINTIPVDLIDRIDILTGGASAAYGSDAIAGVVNFILKDHYDGIQARAQTGVSTYGDAGKQYVSLLAGKNFADGRGNIAVNFEYSHSSAYFGSDRPNIRQNDAFVITDTDPAGTTNGSDGVFDRTFYRDIRSATISIGGMVAIFPNTTTAPCGTNVSVFTCPYQFQSDGTLVAQTGTRIGIGPNGNFTGGNGSINREGKLTALSPELTRYSANLVAHFEISEAFVPFVEATFSRTKAFGSQSGPFFSQGTTLGDPGGRERVRLDNPYLSTQARTLLTQQFLATNVNPNTGGALTAATLLSQQNAVNAGSFRFNLRRNWVDLGIRDEEITRDTYRIVGGVKGDFNDDWNYEISVNYGEHKESNIIRGNVNVQRYLLALDSTKDLSGNIVCRSKLNPTTTVSYVTGDTTSDPMLAADIAGCVPLNPFGEGSVTQAVRDYLTVNSSAVGKITQFDVMGFVSGDTSGFFNLPGGPVSFSLGGEYRRETNFYDLDDVTQAGYAFYNAIPSFTAPAFEVTEGFAEIQLPILKDTPFFQELTVKGNGRVAHYNGGAGTVYAYGGEGTWKPINDLTLRASYSHSIRAPNLSELYSTPGQNFAPGFVDPCSARNVGTGSATRAANCTAAGAPAGYDFVYLQSLEIVSGGNPSLKAETSNSLTFGAIVQPRFIPGLSVSVDYYNITVDGVIASVTAQNIANLCYDSPTLSNQFCTLFKRNAAGTGPAGEIPFQILEASLLQSSTNFAKLKARGIDTNVNYVHNFDWGQLKLAAVWTHVLTTDQYTNPSDPTFVNRLLNELGDPKDQVNLDASIKYGKVTFGYQMRYIGGMYLNTYEDYNALNGQPPQNADYAPIIKYPSVFYHDVRLGLDVNEKFNIYLGVDNIADKQPPYGLTGIGAGSGIYDNRGRYMYAGVVAKF